MYIYIYPFVGTSTVVGSGKESHISQPGSSRMTMGHEEMNTQK